MPHLARHLCVLAFAAVAVLAGHGAASAAVSYDTVRYDGAYPPGTIVVETAERHLYLVLPEGIALRYSVGVGRAGWQWSGSTYIDAKFVEPNWSPPPDIRREQPNLPDVIPGGSPQNPMGIAAMTLAGGAYAIHGTNAPDSIGGFVSYGCIRMYNDDIADLFARVAVGTIVVVRP